MPVGFRLPLRESAGRAHAPKVVMRGLGPRIHVFYRAEKEGVDGRHKAGHDDGE
jgi:hypothetical protein